MIFIACPASLASCQLGLHDPDNMAGSPLDGAVGPGWSAEPAFWGNCPAGRPSHRGPSRDPDVDGCSKQVLGGAVRYYIIGGTVHGTASLAVVSGMLLWGRREKRGKRGNNSPSMTMQMPTAGGARRWPASYERRQCCWNPETPSQSAGVRGATLDFCRCLQWGWPTCALRDSLPVAGSLPGSLAAQVPTSSRLPDGYHRANGTGASSGFGSAGQLPPLKRSFCTPHRTAPRS